MIGHRVPLRHTYPRTHPPSGLILCDTCGRNMRGITSGSRSNYRDVTHVNHSGNCVQKTVRAEVAEQQVADLLCAVKLPPDRQEWVMNNKFPVQPRLHRATELHLGGAMSKENYQAEKWHAEGVRRTGPVVRPAAPD